MKPGGAQSGLAESFAHAARGVSECAKGRNFRIELGFAAAAVALGLAFGNTPGQWLAVFACIGAVLGSECMNTAIEAAVDLASPDLHPLARRAKDAAAAGVLLVAAGALAVGVALYAPPILNLVLGGPNG